MCEGGRGVCVREDGVCVCVREEGNVNREYKP